MFSKAYSIFFVIIISLFKAEDDHGILYTRICIAKFKFSLNKPVNIIKQHVSQRVFYTLSESKDKLILQH